LSWFEEFWANAKNPIAILGFVGQAVFFMRFLVQWLATEREKRSVIPIAFWYFSIGGAMLLLLYGILDRDPVIVLGQCTGVAIYLRNLYFIRKAQAADSVELLPDRKPGECAEE
jgi:lipid-A-disaccharide synthase-like uncharacterized protein